MQSSQSDQPQPLNIQDSDFGERAPMNYCTTNFGWNDSMKDCLKRTFRVNEFRPYQQGVCNANLEGRDTICIMPTGAGKSITYQLPALLAPGLTIVIAPLLSLIIDQVTSLRKIGVSAERLSTGMTNPDYTEIFHRLRRYAWSDTIEDDIKLLYVTPERFSNPYFIDLLHELTAKFKIERIVIDEAHCISESKHRPDYQKLYVIRNLFPQVPISVLTATCCPLVLKDILNVVGLKDISSGLNASANGAVFFITNPYRSNLHYRVRHKNVKGDRLMDDIASFIRTYHARHSGIIYCFSKKDAEKMAEGLKKRGRIETGVYHADRTEEEKKTLHQQWKEGQIKIICATTAFGLGIDKADVRFVIHHTLPKSLNGLCQESGRAGRDGKDADCIVYYNAGDVSRLISMVHSGGEDWDPGLHAIFRFAQNQKECRKVQFMKYFYDPFVAPGEASESTDIEACGHCDICTGSVGTVKHRDVTFESWQILQILRHITSCKKQITLSMLPTLARGGCTEEFVAFSTSIRTGGTRKEKGLAYQREKINLDVVCEGPVRLDVKDIEVILVELLLQGYLKPLIKRTNPGRKDIAYIALGPKAGQLLEQPKEVFSAVNKPFPSVQCSFRISLPSLTPNVFHRYESDSDDDDDDDATLLSFSSPRKRARRMCIDSEGDSDSNSDYFSDNGTSTLVNTTPAASSSRLSASSPLESRTDTRSHAQPSSSALGLLLKKEEENYDESSDDELLLTPSKPASSSWREKRSTHLSRSKPNTPRLYKREPSSPCRKKPKLSEDFSMNTRTTPPSFSTTNRDSGKDTMRSKPEGNVVAMRTLTYYTAPHHGKKKSG